MAWSTCSKTGWRLTLRPASCSRCCRTGGWRFPGPTCITRGGAICRRRCGLSSISCRRARSIQPDRLRLDHLAPFFALGPGVGRHLVRGAGNRFQSERFEARLDGVSVDRLEQRAVQGLDGRRRCLGRRHHALPGVGFEAGQSLLVQGRDGVETGNPLQAGHADGAQLAGADMRAAGRRVDEHEGHLAAGGSHIRAGKLRAIGVASLKRVPGFDAIPTLNEQGLAGFEAYAWQG
ncbi:MAG: hypothetical protein EOP35_26680, partial [Rubrivivax sp.]